MLQQLVSTPIDYSLAAARILLGVVIFAHGAQKVLGWFGGPGFSGTVGFFKSIKMPVAIAYFAILSEFFGGVSLLLGLLSRVAALAIIGLMIGAVLTVHLRFGFFMNWFGNQKGEGYEYHLLAIAVAIVIVVHGAGALSLDSLLVSSAVTG